MDKSPRERANEAFKRVKEFCDVSTRKIAPFMQDAKRKLDDDLKILSDALQAPENAAQDVKPLDLSNCLKHVHAAGAFGVEWVNYEPGPSHSYERINNALAQPNPSPVNLDELKREIAPIIWAEWDDLIDKQRNTITKLVEFIVSRNLITTGRGE